MLEILATHMARVIQDVIVLLVQGCYVLSPYLRTDRESMPTMVMQRQEGSLFITSALGPKSHPAQGNPTRAPNKGVWQLIYRQFFVSVTGVAGVIWLARQDEHVSCLFLVNMTQVLETVVWSLTDPWVGKIPWKRAWQPTPVLLPGESNGQRSLTGYKP